VEPDRFDDVELQMLEQPEEQRGPRRATRWAIGVVAATLTAGAMAAGAWALTSSDDAPAAAPAAKPSVQRVDGDAAWRGDHPCHRERRSTSSSATVRY
jgi:heme A synthase